MVNQDPKIKLVPDSDSVLEKLQQRVWNKFESGIPIKVKLLEVKTFSDSGDGFPEKKHFRWPFRYKKILFTTSSTCVPYLSNKQQRNSCSLTPILFF